MEERLYVGTGFRRKHLRSVATRSGWRAAANCSRTASNPSCSVRQLKSAGPPQRLHKLRRREQPADGACSLEDSALFAGIARVADSPARDARTRPHSDDIETSLNFNSLRVELDETLTVMRLDQAESLERVLSSTNPEP